MIVEKTYTLPFPVDQVFSAWVSSDTVIPPATRMDILPEPGGHYRLFVESEDFSGKNEGKFLRVEPNAHITYTWEWNDDGEVTTIDVLFAEARDGCTVTLTHSGFTRPESVAGHATGWDSYIEGLKAFLAAS